MEELLQQASSNRERARGEGESSPVTSPACVRVHELRCRARTADSRDLMQFVTRFLRSSCFTLLPPSFQSHCIALAVSVKSLLRAKVNPGLLSALFTGAVDRRATPVPGHGEKSRFRSRVRVRVRQADTLAGSTPAAHPHLGWGQGRACVSFLTQAFTSLPGNLLIKPEFPRHSSPLQSSPLQSSPLQASPPSNRITGCDAGKRAAMATWFGCSELPHERCVLLRMHASSPLGNYPANPRTKSLPLQQSPEIARVKGLMWPMLWHHMPLSRALAYLSDCTS